MVSRTDTIYGNTTGVFMSTSKKLRGIDEAHEMGVKTIGISDVVSQPLAGLHFIA